MRMSRGTRTSQSKDLGALAALGQWSGAGARRWPGLWRVLRWTAWAWVGISVSSVLHAQVVHDFIFPDTPFPGGLLADFSNDTIAVDQNGDGQVDEVFDLPLEIQGQPNTLLQFSLDPSQEVLYSVRSAQTSGTVCGGSNEFVELYFHRLVVGATNTMTTLTPGGACLRGPLSGGPYYFNPDPAFEVRTAFVVGAPTIGMQQLLFVDLVNGNFSVDGLNYEPNINLFGGFQVSPAGNALYVQQDSVIPRWRVIDQCASRVGATGSASAAINGGQVSAQLVVSGNDLFTRVTNTPPIGPPTETNIPMSNCFSGTQPPDLEELHVQVLGAGVGVVASQPSGIFCPATCTAAFLQNSAVTLTASIFAGQFGGWGGACSFAGANPQVTVTMDQSRTCTATFTGPQVSITKTGPAQVQAGVDFDYVLTATNTGDGIASGVVMRDTLPVAARFIDASAGGSQAGGVVSWSLNDLGPGDSSQVTLTVDSCSAGLLVNDTYDVFHSLLFAPTPGSPSVSTQVTGGPAAADVSATLASVPSSEPLLPGGTITHTITINNLSSSLLPGLSIPIQAGSSVTLDQFVDDGGGSFNQTGPTSAQWTGDITPGASVQLVFTVVVDACFFDSGNQLNFGSPVQLLSACGTALESIPVGPPIALQRPVSIAAELRNLDPAQQPPALVVDVTTMRPTQALELEFKIENNSAEIQQGVVARLPIPAGLEAAMDPPFLAPTDANGGWDANAEELSWTGDLAPGQSAIVTVALRQSSDVACVSRFQSYGSIGTCSNLSGRTDVLRFADLPQGPYLQGVDAYSGLFVWEPGVDLGFRELLCFQGEISQSLQIGAAGDLWLGGLPSYRANPSEASFQFESVTFPGGPAFPRDIGWLDATGEAVFTQGNDLVAFNVQSGIERTVVANGPFHYGLDTDSNGRIVLQTPSGLEALNAATGASEHAYVDASLPLQFLSFVEDTDGDYLSTALVSDGSGGFVQHLVEIDPATGVFTIVVSDLGTLAGVPTDLNSGLYFTRLTVDPQGLIYALLRTSNRVFALDRSVPSMTDLTLLGGTQPTQSPGIQVEDLSDVAWMETVAPRVDLEVVASGPPLGSPGQPAAFQFTVHNHANVPAREVRLRTAAASGLSISNPVPSAGACSLGFALECTVGTIGAGQSVTVDLMVTPTAVGTFEWPAYVFSLERDAAFSDNLILVPFQAASTGGFDLGVVMSADPQPVSAGTLLTYSLEVSNAGPDAVADAAVSVDLPDAVQATMVSFVGATCTGSDPIDCVANTVLSAGGQWSGTIEVSLPADLVDGAVLGAVATVSGTGVDLNLNNDSVAVEVALTNQSDLSISITDDFDPALILDPVTYEATVVNEGPANSAGSTLTLQWSANAEFLSASGCTATGQEAICALAGLASGVTFTQPLVLRATAAGPLLVQSQVSANGDPNAANDGASEATGVLGSNNENIDPNDLGEQWASSATFGLIDLEPFGDGGPGVSVRNDGLDGWFFNAGLGWCSTNCEQAGTCADLDYGVDNDGAGRLSGLAWCGAQGGLSFSCETTANCATEAYGVTINSEGLFGGRAWSSVFGWVDFDLASPSRARSSWQPSLFGDGFESGDASAWSP